MKEIMNFKSKEVREYIDNNILTSKEATEILGFSSQYLNQLVKEGKLVPIRKGQGIYLKKDIYELKEKRERKL